MATRLKNLLINNSKLKYVSLVLLIISLSTLFETLFNIIFSFRGSNMYNYISIPNYYFFGKVNHVWGPQLKDDYIIIAIILGLLTLMFALIYYFNRNTSNKLDNKIKNLISKISLEMIIVLILITLVARYFVWDTTLDFYDNILILMDSVILILVFMQTEYIKIYKENLDNKSIIYRFAKKFIYKQKNKSLNKKLASWFLIAITVNFSIISLISIESGYYYYTNGLVFAILGSLPLAIILLYVYKKLSKKFSYIEYISTNVKNIEDGNLKYQLKVDGKDEVSNLAVSINNITKGLDIALENQIKSEKMKTELITNVSHDLKTPLTSIVNYVDILKNNELDSDTIKDYINILDRKSNRLKALVEDIFEASKISSGDIELNIEKIDIKELLIQSIVELEDKIESSNLDFVIDTPDECIYTMIDGKRIYRVFDNLINNILKYSLSNTRVYIDMYIDNDNINIIFKNISNHRLNMKPEELLERFRRGDVSRNTEGSGLGLSIAQNLVSIQDGSMDLYIDGDLFKVILKFKTI